MSELWQLGALELASLIRSGEVSSREVVEPHLGRVDADAGVAAGADLGVLHGVPITVKENIDLAGTPTTQGIGTQDAVGAPDPIDPVTA